MPDIAKAYEPQEVESKWYRFWLDQNCFHGNAASSKPAYSIVIPPPNVTGVLTLGHVLNNTIQDILARKARMDGKEVLWLPGTDHAGIATQTVVEKTLKKQKAIRHRDDLGRDKFLEKVWEWKDKHGGIIIEQLKRLGASCDWSRERFTMDADYSRCVTRVFVDLYKKGLIYRGKRMVNWCPVSLTALSDEEVIMKEQQGFLYYFKVEVVEEPGRFLTIATTRPETIPGDTAVAVSPKDERYAGLIGKHIKRPLPQENQAHLPIVGDDHIDPEFGTGVLKVTPAHDKADFEIGQRHELEAIEVIGANGKMNALAGKDLDGLDRFEARKLAAEKLRELGSMEKEEPYTNNVGFSERADVPIEPRLSEQWFLKYPSVEKSRDCVAQGEMRFFPERWAKVYDHWMANIQDWCISRQLWWGHRIPVWSCHLTPAQGASAKSSVFLPPFLIEAWHQEQHGDPHVPIVRVFDITAGNREDITKTVVNDIVDFSDGRTEIEIEVATSDETFGCRLENDPVLGMTQDTDVLDTWFSSWFWPFATMGWLDDKEKDGQNETLRKFYPTTDLVTGPDIIFFWVARMIMAGYEFMGDLPFQNVYFTGIIRDKQGRKMSKSLGNSPDPLDLIGQYGADALRMGVMRSAPLGQDVIYDEQNVELGRNFCNKLWNACRFRLMQGGEIQAEIDPDRLRSDDKWILIKLHLAIQELDRAFAEYRFNEATQTLHRFFWNEYCDWYIESCKAVFFGDDETKKANTLAVIDFVLSHTLRLFHPFIPFITEELWQSMGFSADMPEDQGGKTIMFAPWPKPFDDAIRDHYSLDDCYLKTVTARYELISLGRNLRSESKVQANVKVKFIYKPIDEPAPNDLEVMKLLLNAEEIEVDPYYKAGKGTVSAHSPLGELYLPLAGLVDFEAERTRLEKELGKIEEEIIKAEKKLSNPAFRDKAPAQVLEEHQTRLRDWQSKHDHVRKAIEALGEN